MKFTNQEIINTLNALDSIAEKDFPIQMTYKIIDLQEKLMNSYQTYDKAKAKVKNNDELLDLLAIEVELDIEPINKNELIESEISLSPVQLVGLKKVIDG